MKIDIGNKLIAPTKFSNVETAWKIEDAISIIGYLCSNETIILGGDILTEHLEHNYDNWYYNIEVNQTTQFNIECSSNVAIDYISNYIKLNGNNFYVVFVTDKPFQECSTNNQRQSEQSGKDSNHLKK